MDPKDFKFDDNAFDDVFSDVPDVIDEATPDAVPPESGKEFEYDNVFSGKKDFEFYEMTNGSSRPYTEDYYEDSKDGEFRQVSRRENNVSSQQPYSYNYSKASQNRARRVSKENFADSVEDVRSGRQPRDTKKRKRASFGKIIAVFLIFVMVAAVGVAAIGYYYARNLLSKVNYKPLESNKYVDSSELLHKDGVRNILLVGVDARPGEENSETRSDTMMLLTIDDNNGQIKLSSFLRDTYIEIPDYKQAKLNAAHSHGGTQLLVDTLEYNFGIDIDNYVLVNFDMFTTIIDSLGGVDVEVSDKEADYINSKDHMTDAEAAYFPKWIKGGNNHFDGGQALWYSRIRYLDSDFMRTQRQRKVISAVIGKAKHTDLITLVKTAEKIVPMIETDLSVDELVRLGLNALKYRKYDIAQQQIPAEGTWKNATKNKQAVLEIDLEKNKEILEDFIFERSENTGKG